MEERREGEGGGERDERKEREMKGKTVGEK